SAPSWRFFRGWQARRASARAEPQACAAPASREPYTTERNRTSTRASPAMFFDPAMMAAGGPPPQAVLDKRPCWIFLAVLLLGIAIVRFITVDLVGGILAALMFSMAWMMISDGMVEMHRCRLSSACCACCACSSIWCRS
ncbi:unnamed protein product, partial [Prorocentrum cordatum]